MAYEDRLRQSQEERLREQRYYAYQAHEAEQILKEARYSQDAELRRLEEELRRERRCLDAERSRADSLEEKVHRFREDRRSHHGDADRDLQAAREEIQRLRRSNDELHQQVSTRESQLQQGWMEVRAARGELERSRIERRRLQEQLQHYIEREHQGYVEPGWSGGGSCAVASAPLPWAPVVDESGGDVAWAPQPSGVHGDQGQLARAFSGNFGEAGSSFGSSPKFGSLDGAPLPSPSSGRKQKSQSPGGSSRSSKKAGKEKGAMRGAMRKASSSPPRSVSFSQSSPDVVQIEQVSSFDDFK